MQNTIIFTLLLPLVAMPLLMVACGSPPTPKPATESNGTAASVADAGAATSSASTDDAGVTPTPVATGAPDAGGAAGDLSSSTQSTHNDDADDACQAVAAAFEKRARPQIKACYREGKKKDANLVGGVRIAVAVNGTGKLGNVLTSPNGDKTMLPAAVVKCMVDAVKATDPGDVTKCKGKSLAFPVQFPSQ